MADKTIDARGLSCPLPILKTRKGIREVPVGATLEVLTTDPGAVADFETFSEITGHRLLEHSATDGVFRFLLQRSA